MFDEFNQIVMKIVPLQTLHPHEEINRHHAMELSKEIATKGFWSSPIVCDTESQIIMDGHHRFASAQFLELKYVPCFCVPYDDRFVSIETWRHAGKFTIQDILMCVKERRLLPPKSTRHLFAMPLIQSHIPLSILR